MSSSATSGQRPDACVDAVGLGTWHDPRRVVRPCQDVNVPGHRPPARASTSDQRLPGGRYGPHAQEFIKDQYRHCKPILVFGASDQLLKAAGIHAALPSGQPDPGLLVASDLDTAGDGLIAAIAKHRHFARETDPPRI